MGLTDSQRKAMFAKQRWKIGFVIPNVKNNDSEEIFREVTKAFHKITDKYPELKKSRAFKSHDEGKDDEGFIGSGSVL